MAKVVIIGPAYPLRGGLATFDQRLAQQFSAEGHDCSIYSFSLQYPSILFPGKTQYSDDPPPADIRIKTVINSINPLNWIKVGQALRKEKPDLIVVRFWIPFMGPVLGTILRRVKQNRHTKIVCIADNVIPHEKRPGDGPFTRYFLKACDGFITMSEKVMNDLRQYEPGKPALQAEHPLYDNFGDAIATAAAKDYLDLEQQTPLLLFFGFIRHYKGLDILLESMKILKDKWPEKFPEKKMPRLLVAGEFYEDEKPYRELIDQLQIADQLILHTHFIPDSQVKYYVCAADVVIQPYRNATQSGVTPLAYHFEKPMIVTNVGGLPALVPHGTVGLVTAPDAEAIASGILTFFALGAEKFIPHLRAEKEKFSWHTLIEKIFTVSNRVSSPYP